MDFDADLEVPRVEMSEFSMFDHKIAEKCTRSTCLIFSAISSWLIFQLFPADSFSSWFIFPGKKNKEMKKELCWKKNKEMKKELCWKKEQGNEEGIMLKKRTRK